LHPQERRFRTDLVGLYEKAGRKDDAERVLREGVRTMPDDEGMKHLLVAFLEKEHGPEVAEKEIRTFMEAAPKADQPLFWLVELYMRQGATDKAAALLEKIAAEQPNEKRGLNATAALAQIALIKGDRAGAEAKIGAVLARDPNNRPTLFLKARLAFESGRTDDAVMALRTLLRDAPRDEKALQLLGEALLQQKRLDLAADAFARLAETAPSNLAARVRYAQVLAMKGDSRKAYDILVGVTKAEPTYPQGWESLARIAIGSKDWTTAGLAIKTLEGLKGQQTTALFLKASLLAANGNPAEAMAFFRQTIEADPKASLAHFALSGYLESALKAGKTEEGIAFLRGLKDRDATTETLLGELLLNADKPQEAARSFDAALALPGVGMETYLDRAKLFAAEKKTAEAESLLKKAAEAFPKDPRAVLLQADLSIAQGRPKEAIALYESLLARDPGLDLAANNAAQLTADFMADDAQAMARARQWAERFAQANDPFLLDTLGWVCLRQGDLKQARVAMDRVLAAKADLTPEVHYHLGALLAKEGKTAEALEELKKATDAAASYTGLDEAKALYKSLAPTTGKK
jgi:tetratricopeptide (TPR) repeat protein